MDYIVHLRRTAKVGSINGEDETVLNKGALCSSFI